MAWYLPHSPVRTRVPRAVRIAFVLFAAALAVPRLAAQPARLSALDNAGVRKLVRDGGAKATLVNLWATWCLPCREEMPSLLKLRAKYSGAGFRLLLVSADGVEAADSVIPAALRRFGIDFPTYVDADSSDEAMINGFDTGWSGALPASFLYDSTGTLVKTLVGGKSFDTFEKSLLPLLR